MLFALSASAQQGADAGVEAIGIGPDASETARIIGRGDFRDTSANPFAALSRTVRDMQHLAYALQLRDYCADDRVSDEFVRVQLARFSLLTGREETCASLKDY
ncbi:hypothetical protein ACKVEX_11825 [Rhodocyclaceae bacterium SMB388]